MTARQSATRVVSTTSYTGFVIYFDLFVRMENDILMARHMSMIILLNYVALLSSVSREDAEKALSLLELPFVRSGVGVSAE